MCPAASANPAVVVHRSPFSHDETLSRLLGGIEARGLEVFARFDHAANARRAGLEMAPTEVIVFGDPATGTPLMLASPDLALDLPSRVLVRQEPDGVVSVLHHDGAQLGARYGLGPELLGGLASLAGFVGAVLTQAD